MPARQAAATLEQTFAAIPHDAVDEVILVDDSSTDETVELARRLPLHLVWHPHQVGYGGNQKTCYLEALQHDADVVVMLHPDGQYEPELIPRMIEPILRGEADLVLGSRLLLPGAALAAGMPRWKYVANRFLTAIENRIMGTEPVRGPHGLPRVLAPAAADGPVPAQLARLRVRLRAAHAGVALRLHDRRGPGPLPLLRGRVVGRLQGRRGLRVKTLWAGVAAVLHRRGILRSRKFSARAASSTHREPALGRRDRPQPVARVDPLQRPLLERREPRAADRRAGRARIGAQRGQHPRARPRPSACGRPAAARRRGRAAPAARRRRRSSPPTGRRGTAGRRARCAAGSRCPRSGATSTRLRALARHVAGEQPLAGGRRGCERRRIPEPVERRRAASSPPGSGVGERRAREALADRRPGDRGDERRRRERRARARRSAPRRGDAGARAQQQPEPERAREQRRQRDVDEDVALRAVDVVAHQHDPVGGHPGERDERRPLALDAARRGAAASSAIAAAEASVARRRPRARASRARRRT